MAKTETESKPKTEFDFMTHMEQDCFDTVTVKGKDWHGKKATGTWPRDKPQPQIAYETWLARIKDEDTGEYHHHLIKQIIRFTHKTYFEIQ